MKPKSRPLSFPAAAMINDPARRAAQANFLVQRVWLLALRNPTSERYRYGAAVIVNGPVHTFENIELPS
jgi:hypothetical protein